MYKFHDFVSDYPQNARNIFLDNLNFIFKISREELGGGMAPEASCTERSTDGSPTRPPI